MVHAEKRTAKNPDLRGRDGVIRRAGSMTEKQAAANER
jgi:hypothetical protein